MKVVKVYGALRKRLGQGTFELNVETPAQALKALFANFDGLEKWFIDNDQNGIAYKVLVGKAQIGQENIEELEYPWSQKEVFSITPVLVGAGRGGFGRFLLGAAMVGAVLMTGGIGAAGFAGGFGGATIGTFGIGSGIAVGSLVGGMGVALMLGGISQMLSPQPTLPKDARRNDSFGFGGVTNTVNQGVPVPICYGRLYVGSSAISVGLDTDQVV
tara:strand:- start:1087 stop:1731 length:645 start_codon:yes stop_codon:yes gene_type:complete